MHTQYSKTSAKYSRYILEKKEGKTEAKRQKKESGKSRKTTEKNRGEQSQDQMRNKSREKKKQEMENGGIVTVGGGQRCLKQVATVLRVRGQWRKSKVAK